MQRSFQYNKWGDLFQYNYYHKCMQTRGRPTPLVRCQYLVWGSSGEDEKVSFFIHKRTPTRSYRRYTEKTEFNKGWNYNSVFFPAVDLLLTSIKGFTWSMPVLSPLSLISCCCWRIISSLRSVSSSRILCCSILLKLTKCDISFR